jgi:SAM-dependent methyltransferase
MEQKVMDRELGPEAARSYRRRLAEGFFAKYLSGDAILDIGFRGGNPASVPITDRAIGVELDYPGYDGVTLPFPDESQDSVFASHCLEHIEDYRMVLADWFRVLKIGGFMIIAVPHQHLYERKSELPSRFNGDHKRFYTPRSLLSEIEEALPLGGHRVRSLRDIDDDFDYSMPPEQHARGCYEIELVLQKIPIPAYAERLRSSFVAKQALQFFTSMLAHAIEAARCGRDQEVSEVQAILVKMPLPAFSKIVLALRKHFGNDGDVGQFRREELVEILRPIVRAAEFDEAWYRARYKAVDEAVAEQRIPSAHAHYVAHGYFEGRSPTQNDVAFS